MTDIITENSDPKPRSARITNLDDDKENEMEDIWEEINETKNSLKMSVINVLNNNGCNTE